MNEIWLPIKNFEGEYEVSNLGRVRSKKGVVLKRNPQIRFFIHRLVADACVVNPNPALFTKEKETRTKAMRGNIIRSD